MSDAAPLDPGGHRVPGEPIRFTYSHDGQSRFRRLLIRTVERLSGRAHLEVLYRQWRATGTEGNPFEAALRLLEVNPVFGGVPMSEVPAEGGLLLVANHPFGIADGLALGLLASSLRSEVRIMTHALLCTVPELRPYLLPVDFSGSADARKTSADTRRAAVDLLRSGGALVVFPGGSVATSNRPVLRPAAELPWHPFVGRLAVTPGTTVLPVHVRGQNSALFQAASHLSYPMRVALLFHETTRLIGRQIDLTLGAPLASEALRALDRNDIAPALRRLSLSLGGASEEAFVWPRHIRW